MGISVVLLAKNEAENLDILLPEIIDQIKKTKEEFEIIVIDGQSTEDNTKEICEKYDVAYINQRYPYFGGGIQNRYRKCKVR